MKGAKPTAASLRKFLPARFALRRSPSGVVLNLALARYEFGQWVSVDVEDGLIGGYRKPYGALYHYDPVTWWCLRSGEWESLPSEPEWLARDGCLPPDDTVKVHSLRAVIVSLGARSEEASRRSRQTTELKKALTSRLRLLEAPLEVAEEGG